MSELPIENPGEYGYAVAVNSRDFLRLLTAGLDVSQAFAQTAAQSAEAWTLTYWLSSTDMNYHFELGRRLFSVEKYDEAIAEFQKAQADPKHRPASLHYLGRCYTKRGWFDEAIDTLREGEKAVAANDAKLSMRILYALMDALERAADESQSLELAIDAQKTASKILQTDINYLDIRDRMDRIKTLVTKLRSG